MFGGAGYTDTVYTDMDVCSQMAIFSHISVGRGSFGWGDVPPASEVGWTGVYPPTLIQEILMCSVFFPPYARQVAQALTSRFAFDRTLLTAFLITPAFPIMVKGFTHMTPTEIEQARRWTDEDHMKISRIAKLMQRDVKTVRKYIKKRGLKEAGKVGRPPMTQAEIRQCNTALVMLQKAAKAEKEVTAAMVIKRSGVKYGERRVRDALRDIGKPFKKLREKPKLTASDVLKRRVFTNKYGKKTKASWVTCPHAIIDNKKFPMYLDRKAREHAAQRSIRGAYRSGDEAVASHLVKPKATLKFPAPGVIVAAGVIRGRIRMWHVVEGKWNAREAVKMYAELRKTMAKAFPDHAARPSAKWVVLEDNDPTGYKSSAGVAKKQEEGMKVMELPPRSPDLNVLDYSLWHEINTRLRAQEAKFRKNKKETKAEFLARLRHTARTLPPSVVTKAVQSMKKRCRLIKDAKGYLINE